MSGMGICSKELKLRLQRDINHLHEHCSPIYTHGHMETA